MYGIDTIGFEQQRGLEAYAGPGHWNDADMLVVGLRGKSKEITGAGCTDTEYRTHFSLWCMLAAPLMIGCDVRTLDGATRRILTNREAIALDQDSLGKQGYRVSRNGFCELWKKPLAGGQIGLGVFNRGDNRRVIPVHWSDLELTGPYQVRDLWAHEEKGVADTSISVEVEPHGCVLMRMTPLV